MKYNICFALSLLLPVLFLVYSLVRTKDTDKQLIKMTATMNVSKKISRGARSDAEYIQKFDEFKATLSRTFSGLGSMFRADKLKDIYLPAPANMIPDIYWEHPKLKPAEERKASFYIFKTDQQRINDAVTVPYVYLKLDGESRSEIGYATELYLYTLGEKIGGLTIFFTLIINLILFIVALQKYQESKLYVGAGLIIVLIYILLLLF